ncbi:glycoside hydrolase family 3 C-terminal domain-containing protein [Actinoplanes subtropicus]|uniref:glycoside hydrolase family 3 C-terminal domain-containing protein n=1 Tax=Actinoplanes subtropicus TaxID=543632 RepID=UPI001FE202F9|nr:glycoside hydrolase family 3 C-terminal domain-containing protein [Actinoplanes subtropicus]
MRVHRRLATWLTVLGLVVLSAGCQADAEPRNRVDELLSRMSLADKIGRMTPAERAALTPEEVRVTAHGTTVFPPAIGLRATRDPGLVERVDAATAEEVTGGYLRDAVATGRIPMSRIDDAVRRVLAEKTDGGLSTGDAAHRDLARQAVRESQVLLKNDDDVLPLAKTGGKIFVAGRSADDLGAQCGGRTPAGPGTTVLQGIRDVAGQHTTITYDRDGAGVDGTYRAAIAVLGGLDAGDRRVLARLATAGIPVVVVLVAGRPLDVAAQVDDWPALIQAWLPGSAGGGVADVLFGDYPPTGRLPVAWPRSPGEPKIKTGLYAYGYGLGYPDRPADSAAPSRPGMPVATAGKLSWTASTDEAGGSGIDGYDVLRDGTLIGTTTTAGHPLGTLPPGVHDFTVVARDKAGNRSAPSAPLEITVPFPGGCKTRHGPCAVT